MFIFQKVEEIRKENENIQAQMYALEAKFDAALSSDDDLVSKKQIYSSLFLTHQFLRHTRMPPS